MKKHQNSKLKKATEFHELCMPPIANVFAQVWFCREWGALRLILCGSDIKQALIESVWYDSSPPAAAPIHKKKDHDVYSFHVVFILVRSS